MRGAALASGTAGAAVVTTGGAMTGPDEPIVEIAGTPMAGSGSVTDGVAKVRTLSVTNSRRARTVTRWFGTRTLIWCGLPSRSPGPVSTSSR